MTHIIIRYDILYIYDYKVIHELYSGNLYFVMHSKIYPEQTY